MNVGAETFKVGDRLELVFDDAPHESITATVSAFESDTEMGFSPEVEDYVACWIDLSVDEQGGVVERRSIVLSTDSRYSLDGRTLRVRRLGEQDRI